MRILILADQCNPEWPSLPIVGYKAAVAIAEQVDVVIATHIRNKPNIDKVGLGKAEVVYIDTEYIAKPIHKLSTFLRGSEGGWTTAMALAYPSYLAFEWEVLKRFKKDLINNRFDIVHRLTPMSPTLPSLLAGKIQIPFVIGPLNGGLKWPTMHLKQLKREKEWLAPLRNIYKFLPFSKKTFTKSSAILASFEHTIQQIPKSTLDKTINFPEVGFDEELFDKLPDREAEEQKTILFVGRLVPYKMPEVVVKAFANSQILQKHKLLIIGDGPLRAELERMVEDYNLDHCIEFLGWKTQKEVGKYMQKCHIFAFPSIRELGAGVIVEAMASGMVSVVVDYGAPGVLVNDSCGIKIPLMDEEHLIQTYRAEMESLIVDNNRIIKLSKNSYETAMKFYSWQKKASKTIAVYGWVLNQNLEKPNFWN